MGMDAVRIPVPYFIFGDRAPFVGCVKELDNAFNWAEKYGLKILIDLHTAPDSQNGVAGTPDGNAPHADCALRVQRGAAPLLPVAGQETRRLSACGAGQSNGSES